MEHLRFVDQLIRDIFLGELGICTGLSDKGKFPISGVIQCHEGTSTVFQQPTADYAEQVFYRRSAEDSFAALVNEKLGLSAKLSFSSKELPWLVEWKQMGQQDYVVGVEPANCLTEGRSTAREQGILQYIAPQEEKHFHLTIMLEG